MQSLKHDTILTQCYLEGNVSRKIKKKILCAENLTVVHSTFIIFT